MNMGEKSGSPTLFIHGSICHQHSDRMSYSLGVAERGVSSLLKFCTVERYHNSGRFLGGRKEKVDCCIREMARVKHCRALEGDSG